MILIIRTLAPALRMEFHLPGRGYGSFFLYPGKLFPFIFLKRSSAYTSVMPEI